MKEFILFWTYSANYADKPLRLKATSYIDAVRNHFYSANPEVRFIVFEVGGDLVFDGTVKDLPESLDVVDAYYLSEYGDNGITIRTKCKLNPKTGEVTDIEVADIEGLTGGVDAQWVEHLDHKYIGPVELNENNDEYVVVQ